MAALPVTVSVVVESSGTVIPNVIIRPTDTIKGTRARVVFVFVFVLFVFVLFCLFFYSFSDVRANLMQQLALMGNQVISQNNHCVFMLQRTCDIATNQKSILDETISLGSLKIEPGSRLIWKGDVKLKADVQELCFSIT
jgi:hypothetical protein